ncbi:MAG: UvrD-helicase domain-containing protein, partial [Bryocella sp.]
MSKVVPIRGAVSSEGDSDVDARTRALDIQRSCIVEAPAGSGKTGLLMQRYLKLLADPAVTQPEEVLAITFTNKATAELRERVVKQLEVAANDEALDGSASPFDRETNELAQAALEHNRQLGWDVLSRPQRLNIRTIDSICASIANSLPILSGAGGSLRPSPDASPLHHLAAERTLVQLGGADRALHAALYTVLLRRDASLDEVTRLIASMLAGREQWGQLIPLNPDHLTDEYLETK